MARPRLRDTQRLATRERILDAARRRFEIQGFSSATTQDVADEAGVSHGSVFVHFGSRAELIAAVVDRGLGGAEADVNAALEGGGDLKALLLAHLGALAAHEAIYARLVVERPLLPALVQARVAAFDSAVSRRLEDVARAGAVRGLRAGIKPYFAFNTWMALVTYYLINRDLFAPNGLVLRQRRSELVENYLALIG
jgi:AcrR family transcriptional regulator